MSGSGFGYAVFSAGDRAIFDPTAEAKCPYPKTPLPDSERLYDLIEDVWRRHEHREAWDTDTNANAFNVQRILTGILPEQTICPYHLGRALAAATLEVVTGFQGSAYTTLEPALTDLSNRLSSGAGAEFAAEARRCLTTYLAACSTDGSRGFVEVERQLSPFPPPRPQKKRWWS